MQGTRGTLQSPYRRVFRRVACAIRKDREPSEAAEWAFALAAGEASVKKRTWLESIGASLLLLCCDYLPFFHPQYMAVYHHGLPVSNLAACSIIDLAGVACLCIVFLLCCGCARKPVQRVFSALFAG